MMRFLILGLLHHGGPRHGYALMKEYRDSVGRTVSVANVYRELQRLKTRGLVRSATSVPIDSRRRSYEITAAGIDAFKSWLSGPARGGIGGPADDEYGLRAFFVLRMGMRVAPRALSEWREELQAGRRAIERAHEQGGPEASSLSLWLGRNLRHLEIDLDFVSHLESALGPTSVDEAPAQRRGTGR
jgi:DNA-binding PadR family transcriptional regulator